MSQQDWCFMNFLLPPKLEQKYILDSFIGYGSYGFVYRAVDRSTGGLAAVKFGTEKSHREDYKSLMEERWILWTLKHPNIIRLLDYWQVFLGVPREGHYGQKAVLVLEHCLCDLSTVLRMFTIFRPEEIKTMAAQIFKGLEYLQSQQLVHCDIKTKNILLSIDGNLKLCDFGHAKHYGMYPKKTGCTLAYAAPEVLLGTTRIGYQVDSWSAGCVFIEFFKKSRLFQCSFNDVILQLVDIFKLCGSFSKEALKEVVPIVKPKYEQLLSKTYPCTFSTNIAKFVNNVYARNLLRELIVTDPRQRCSAAQALESEYFSYPPKVMANLRSLAEQVRERLRHETW